MALFRRSVPQQELRRAQSDEEREQHRTDYQASRGGWFKKSDQPVPGARREGERAV